MVLEIRFAIRMAKEHCVAAIAKRPQTGRERRARSGPGRLAGRSTQQEDLQALVDPPVPPQLHEDVVAQRHREGRQQHCSAARAGRHSVPHAAHECLGQLPELVHGAELAPPRSVLRRRHDDDVEARGDDRARPRQLVGVWDGAEARRRRGRAGAAPRVWGEVREACASGPPERGLVDHGRAAGVVDKCVEQVAGGISEATFAGGAAARRPCFMA